MRGKMDSELVRDRFDAADDAAFELARPEFALHLGADLFPTPPTNRRIDATIGDDVDIVVGEQQIDQHAVVMRSIPDAQLRKYIDRAFPRRLIAKQGRTIQPTLHHKAQLARMRS